MTTLANHAGRTPPDLRLRHPNELRMLAVCLLASLPIYALAAYLLYHGLRAAWYAGPAAFIVPAILALAAWFFITLFRAFYVAHIRGNGLLVSEAQLPEVKAAVARVAASLGTREPEVYVVQFGGLREAAVRFFLGSRILVLSSRLLEDAGDGPERDFFIGRELGRLKLRHHLWRGLVIPSAFMPVAYPAYCRATEYTADRCGLAACGDAAAAERALLVLAAGGRLGRAASPDRYGGQVADSGGFWMTLAHLIAAKPAIAWRTGQLLRAIHGDDAATPRPHVSALAAFLSVGMPGTAAPGGVFGLAGAVALVAVLASALVPALLDAAEEAKASRRAADLKMLGHGFVAYRDAHQGRPPPDIDTLVREGYMQELPRGQYFYYPPRDLQERAIIACEIEADRDDERFVLFSDGAVVLLEDWEFDRELENRPNQEFARAFAPLQRGGRSSTLAPAAMGPR